MASKNEIDMLHGTLWKKILLFALPIAAMSILQQLFNAADIAVIGHFGKAGALAAVGATGPIVNLFINIFIGFSTGSNAVIARLIGENRSDRIEKAVHTSIAVSLVSGLLLGIAGFFCADLMTAVMKTPADVFEDAVLYLRIYSLGIPFMMVCNFAASIMRSRGDNQRPLYILIAAGILNVLLNLLFVIGFHLDVAGVAAATVFSEALSAVVFIYLLRRDKGQIRFQFKKLGFDRECLAEITKIGLPAGIQGAMFSLSNSCIQAAINSLGTEYISASTAAINIECFVFITILSFYHACMTFTAQNYGAKQYDRCRSAVRWSLSLSLISTVILCLLCLGFAKPVLSIFTSDSSLIEIAVRRLQIILAFQVLNTMNDVLSGGLRGLGASVSPAVICLLGICVFRVLWVALIFNSTASFDVLMAAYPASWTVSTIAMALCYFYVSNKTLGHRTSASK